MRMLDKETASDSALAMARQSLYRFVAISLLDPKAGAWERLRTLRDDKILPEAAAFLRSLPEAVPDQLDSGERSLADLHPSTVLERLPPSNHEFNAQYEHTFGLLVSNGCPPYETEYIDSKFTFQRSNALADVHGFYQAFGLTTSKVNAERGDHIVQELEFMAFLLGLERRTMQEGTRQEKEHLEVGRNAQRRFFIEHLVWWTPTFARLLGRENPDGFYAATGVLLASLIAAERAIMHVPLVDREVQPSFVERPDECTNCLLSANPHP